MANTNVQPSPDLDNAYRLSLRALRMCLKQGSVNEAALRGFRTSMAQMKPRMQEFGVVRYRELETLLSAVEHLPRDTVLIHDDEPMFGREHQRQMEPYRWIPYPYRFKWDPGWAFVLFLAMGGIVFKPFWLLAAVITVIRGWVWLCFRFPITMMFIGSFVEGMIGGRGGRRW